MKVSLVGAASLLVGASTASVFAYTGSNINLYGSERLVAVMQEVLVQCDGVHMGPGNVQGLGMAYQGGGSAGAETAMLSDIQEIAPMGRSLDGAFCGATVGTHGDVTHSAQDMMIGLDGVAVVANTTTTCSSNGLAQSTAFPVFVGGVPTAICQNFTADAPCVARGCVWDGFTCSATVASGCTGCDSSNSNQYTFQNSLDVLKIIFGGRTHDGTVNCAGDVRRSLVNQWHALFQTTCANPTCNSSTLGLTHAWRHSDLSDVTDAFVGLTGLKTGSFGIGTLPTCALPATILNQRACVPQLPGNGSGVPSSSPQLANSRNETRVTNPFCNSPDLQAIPFAVSNGGKSDYTDADPIRIPCNPGDDVCGKKDLGLVLPVDPGDPNIVLDTDNYPTHLCSPGAFALEDPNTGPNAVCPAGPLFLGKCFQPYYLDTLGNPAFDCISSAGFAAFGSPSGTDGRVYNLPLKKADAQFHAAAYVLDPNRNFMTGSYFRIHQNKVRSYATQCSSFTNQALCTAMACTWTSSTSVCGVPVCRNASDAQQIGCLVNADPCSIGYAGREAVPTMTTAYNQALLVNGFAPTVANIAKLVTDPLHAYPLSNRLFLASLVGFQHNIGAERELAKCFGNNPGIEMVLNQNNIVPLSPMIDPGLSGVQCLNPFCCQGTPGTCSANTTQTSCYADSGCIWNVAFCSGTPISGNPACNTNTTQAGCAADSGCTWLAASCSGTSDCTKNSTSAACTADLGCSVTSTSTNCGGIDVISGPP
jgi:hypothetical protein